MANLLSFSFNNERVRTFFNGSHIFFCLSDVCIALSLTNPSKVAQQVKDEFSTPNLKLGMITRPDGSKIQATFITEPQLYFVLFRSRAKIAHEFRQWVFNEVLPTLRKQGAYVANKTETVQPQIEQPRNIWFKREIRAALEGRVNEETIELIEDIASRSWGQGFAIATSKWKKQAGLQDAALPGEEGTVTLSKLDATRLRNMLNYIPQVLELLGEASAFLDLIKKSKLLVPSYDLHFALQHELECLKKALGE